jgi:hypothetical protein
MTEVTQKQLHYFPITPRLKRLFISKRTTGHMRWHKEGIRENDGVMGHPSYSEAWKVLDEFDADFASDERNIHFVLQMTLIHLVPTLHHTLAGPSLLSHTTYHHLCFV